MKLVLQYFYKKRQVIGWSILCGLIYLLIFSLSGIDLKAAVYPALLCLVFGIVFLLVGFFRLIERHRRLEFLEKDKGPYGESLPKAADLCEADYQKLLKKEEQEWRDRQKVWDDTMSDMEDYYAAWVHQIKAPIDHAGTFTAGGYRAEPGIKSGAVPCGTVCRDGTELCTA